ncbi:MAG: hypothetical protein COZ46_07365 [Verrucomicrobia bacterium CG_4_10_14_3_um_filter_43_23]|nr:MAG: hypothetical protein COX01_06590 [Verrucomicrobia bacterium CG22_combo_CG10-13_8_21_14_all_43_17]PIX57757.1 MAG: hypothetical protein COZ46_07365 [Verrucomicrobia bacterium CG_4_10_14_3_um_filter_43_23]
MNMISRTKSTSCKRDLTSSEIDNGERTVKRSKVNKDFSIKGSSLDSRKVETKKKYNWGFQKGMEVISSLYTEIAEGVKKFTNTVYKTIMNPSDHGHNCGLISINYALISEFQNIPNSEDRKAFIDKYRTFLLKGLDSAVVEENGAQQESYEARYSRMSKGASLMLDFLDQIEQEPFTALDRFEKLIAGEENSLAVFGLMRNAIAHQVKAELNGADMSDDFRLSKEDLCDLMSIKDGTFNQDISPCLSTAVMGAFLKGLNLKMTCVTQYGLENLGNENVESQAMNMHKYALFLHSEKSHFYLLSQ